MRAYTILPVNVIRTADLSKMLLRDYTGWIGTKLMVRMPKVPVGILVSPKVYFTAGRIDTSPTILKPLRMTRAAEDHIKCGR